MKRSPPTSVPTTRLVPGQEYRVLSVRPPWAWSIIFAGKDVENRSWATPYRGPLIIHASGHRESGGEHAMNRSEIASSSGMALTSVPIDFPRSAIIGIVDLVDIVEGDTSPWAGGELNWILRNPRALAQPIQGVGGKLKLWRWTAPGESTEGRAHGGAIHPAHAAVVGGAPPSDAASTTEDSERRARSIDDVGPDEVLAALRELASSAPVNDVELMRSVSRKLGFARMGARVEAGLRTHVRRAVRSGLLAREGKMLRRVS